MQLVWNFLKAAIVLGILGYIGYFIYQKVNEKPATKEDVLAIAQAISQIVGETKPELSMADKPSVEFQCEKLKAMHIDTIRDGLLMLDPGATRAQYIAAELILLRVYESRAEGYVSRIDGDPWDVSGDLTQMGQFEIDRTPGATELVSEMVEAYGPSVTPRSNWKP